VTEAQTTGAEAVTRQPMTTASDINSPLERTAINRVDPLDIKQLEQMRSALETAFF
jgi:hypothetical protein